METCFVYILASRPRGALYIGSTRSLLKRTWEHRSRVARGHTEKYQIDRLVYFEVHEDPYEAFQRERQLKKWKRAWKIELIEKGNPGWEDLWDTLA